MLCSRAGLFYFISYSTCSPNRKWPLPPHFFLIFGWVGLTHGAVSKCRALSRRIVGLRGKNTTFTFGISGSGCAQVTFLCKSSWGNGGLLWFELAVWYRGTAFFCAGQLKHVHLKTNSLLQIFVLLDERWGFPVVCLLAFFVCVCWLMFVGFFSWESARQGLPVPCWGCQRVAEQSCSFSHSSSGLNQNCF